MRGSAQLQRLLKSPSFGTFLGEARKVQEHTNKKEEAEICFLLTILLVKKRSNESGEPCGLTTTTGQPVSLCQRRLAA